MEYDVLRLELGGDVECLQRGVQGALAVGGAAGTALVLSSQNADPTGTIVVTIPDL